MTYKEILLSMIPYVFTAGIVIGYLVGYRKWKLIPTFLKTRILSPFSPDEATPPSLIREKYQSFHLPEARKEQLLSQVLSLMEEEKMYRDQELSLVSLSARLSVPPRYLSQIINEKKKQNFSDFINQYRIEEAKHILTKESYQRFSLSGIASEVGFSSRQSFHQAFKKFTGMTPGKYRETHPV
ncbi:MAG: helix-turn-helix domain-containing protein [Bacteroidota bacterium]